MLQLKEISKRYQTGELVQQALDGVSLSFRDSEFVSVLGPSGSGKTTLLNIIGGLDRYDGGDLLINDVSTKRYKDRDWDGYRNHTIGFVFQSYNLIPHQSVLANVELALTIGGVSGKERRARARKALEEVGLGDQGHKKPNQLSGGQMQRVAIARALVNDPDILLADEPTGALDSETSVQVMELLKRVAEKRLVVMVTHNGELAERYSTRIVRLRDGRIVDDSSPLAPEKQPRTILAQAPGRAKMSFSTALALSFNNLWTKKGRTLLTAFAGSIGIIGIALILALSSGVNGYIADIQKSTMASYPITIDTQTVDISGMMGLQAGMAGGQPERTEDRLRVYAGYEALEASEAVASNIKENNLTAFKRYLDDPDSEIHQYLGENGVVYGYNVGFSVYSRDGDGVLVPSDADVDAAGSSAVPSWAGGAAMGGSMSGMQQMASLLGGSGGGAENFCQLMPAPDGGPVNPILQENYELLYGAWPEKYDEVVLVLDENNSIPAEKLYQLGLMTGEEYRKITEAIKDGEAAEEHAWDYQDICGHAFYLLPTCDLYRDNGDGTFTLTDSAMEAESLLDGAVELSITGVIRPAEGADNASLTGPVAYTQLLTDYVIARTDGSPVVLAQEADPKLNVLNGMAFEAAAMDRWLAGTPDQDILLMVYDEYIAGGSYADNMAAFGKVSLDAPASISIYTDSFDAKEAVSTCIERYNAGAAEAERIAYTDYAALLTGSVSSMINAISYVLIAFVAVSLVVSSIMIGIITHISVMERTKEIGILRAIGASKRNISQVFNAETIIVGLLAGALGVGVSRLLTLPANSMIQNLLGADGLRASLPWTAAAVLVALSVAITVAAGILPARSAAGKDPVAALRAE